MKSYENEYLRFDTIKIRTKIEYLKDTIIEFNKNYNRHGDITGRYYNSKNDKLIPYNLYIGISYSSQSLTFEFSSKILLDDYPKLISQNTFRQCLENINNLGICIIDVDSITKDCYFDKIHITRDIIYKLTNHVQNSLNSCVANYRRYRWEHYKGEGIRYTKDVKSKDCKESLVIYDKEKEIVKNKDFLSILDNPQDILNYFKGKTRFEMELDSPKKICKYLNIDSTHINNVFNSTTAPLLIQFNKVFGEGEIDNRDFIVNYETYAMDTIIEKHGGDIKKIEQEMKDLHLYSSHSRNGLLERMKKIKSLIQQKQNNLSKSNQILTHIRQKISEKEAF